MTHQKLAKALVAVKSERLRIALPDSFSVS